MAALRPHNPAPDGLFRAAKNARRWQVWTLRLPLRGYVLGIIALAACAVGVAIAHSHFEGSSWLLGVA